MQRQRGAAQVARLRHLLGQPLHGLGQLGGGGLASELGQQPALLAVERPQPLVDVARQPDRAALLGDRAADRLADPDHRVGREAVAAAVVELLHRAQQPERALLDQVGEREAVVVALVALGHVHDEPQVGLGQALLGGEVAALDAPRQPQLLAPA